ncbi:hypothetical protein BV25DRAFT_1810118 [Artomyces pyxidatus]|uniref:Uncharacterized protein n=1 Tax=Artomyces pyxidatus TaxID=48021 RepID=A0ACB8SR74_9AGAM|nr:hypothetical protein BV25DRAFT_1810118 [Artomyces pyxidatus]
MLPFDALSKPGSLLLVTDELASPADFLLHQLLAAHVKGRSDANCIIVSVSGDWVRWKAVASRSGINMAQKLEDKSIAFLDVSLEPGLQTPLASTSLRYILQAIQTTVEAMREGNTLVIVDDLATLEWMGYSFLEVNRLSRALVSCCGKTNVALVIRHHVVVPEEPDAILRTLLQLCVHHLEVRPLSSGKSGAVSGEVALHTRNTLDSPVRQIPRSHAIQYRLTEYHAVYFERGTGSMVL